ncbi:MAG: polyprenyl synthetase family protein [Candidatus Micrarchaeales archaeon]
MIKQRETDSVKNFQEFIKKYKETIHSRISGYLPKERNFFYQEVIPSYVHRMGQYRRPSYVLLWTMLYNGDLEEAMLPAAIQQVSEDWILMHDDILDGNLVRRGGPSAHAQFGIDYAIIGGDALHIIMWKMIKEATDSLGKIRGERYFNKVYDIMFRTSFGQYLDTRITTEIRDITKFTLQDYYESIHAKSAYYTVYGPMQCGAIVASADEETINKIPEYGTPAGNAFQIRDDILDCTSTQEVLGKSVGNDVRDGAKTIILWHAVQNASSATLKKLVDTYKKSREDKSEEEVKFVLDTFRELGSINYAMMEADRLVKDAQERFNKVSKGIPEGPVKDMARDSISNTISRKK